MDAKNDKREEEPHLLREAPGRETRLLIVDGQRVIEKRFSGGPLREAWRERLTGKAARSPARREYEALVALRDAGLTVPAVLSLAEEGRRSSLRMEFVPHSESLAEHLAPRAAESDSGPRPEPSRADRIRLAAQVLELVLGLHRAGWYHRDLYLDHFLLHEGDGELVLIDLGRARCDRSPRERWFEKDIAALEHSTPLVVTRLERLRFLAAYLDGRGVRGRAARREFAAAVGRRAMRMAKHLPRHGASYALPVDAAQLAEQPSTRSGSTDAKS